LFVVSENPHDLLARYAETALDVANFHGIGEHTGEPERHALGILLAFHRHFEAVAKVDMDDLSRNAVEHQVRRMPVAESEDVPHHGHDGQGPGIVSASL